MTLRKLNANFKSFFGLLKNGHTEAHSPNFKGKDHFQTLCYNQSGFKLHDDLLTLSHKHFSGTELSFELKYEPIGDIIQVELYQDHKNRWYVSIICEVEVPPYFDNGLYQAFDPGIENIVSAVNLHGKHLQFANRRTDLYWKDKIAEAQARRDFCKNKSRRWHFYNKKLVSMKRKLRDQLKDFQHKISKVCVENTKANTLIVGKASVKKMAQKKVNGSSKANKTKKTLNHSLQNTGSMSRFTEFLTYKAKKVGKRVIEISERNTTKTCSKCGKKEKRKLSDRVIKCNCGNNMDRDLNSAVNILLRFLWYKF
ncbi:MAG: transposase, partial [Candidatus Heimdallarchaeota archaeon]|nr:transposase [Candidatus Heimdallarchaeota archaeon]